MPLRCPSAQLGMSEVQVLGVVSGTLEAPRITYLNAYLPVAADVLDLVESVPATQVLRLAAKCEEQKCMHFDGHSCQLASRIVNLLDAITDSLPPCIIRKSCRWYAPEDARHAYAVRKLLPMPTARTTNWRTSQATPEASAPFLVVPGTRTRILLRLETASTGLGSRGSVSGCYSRSESTPTRTHRSRPGIKMPASAQVSGHARSYRHGR